MLKEYDIDTLNPRPNPYAKELEQITSQEIRTVSNIANSDKEEKDCFVAPHTAVRQLEGFKPYS